MRKLLLATLMIGCGGNEPAGGAQPPENPTGRYEPGVGALSIGDPEVGLDGYTIWYPAERLGHDPGEPDAVWLEIEKDGVAVGGPTLPASSESLFVLHEPAMSWEIVDESWYGLTVVVNEHLSYRFDIQDFEEEVSVARVDLAMTDVGLESRFVLVADSCDGRAHVSIQALVDGEPVGEPTAPLIIRSTFLDAAREDGYPWGPNCSWAR